MLNNVNLKEYGKIMLNIKNYFYDILTNIWWQVLKICLDWSQRYLVKRLKQKLRYCQFKQNPKCLYSHYKFEKCVSKSCSYPAAIQVVTLNSTPNILVDIQKLGSLFLFSFSNTHSTSSSRLSDEEESQWQDPGLRCKPYTDVTPG